MASLSVENRLQKQLLELKHPEMNTLPSAQSAFNMYERSEISSRAQFATYKQQAQKQWVNEMKVADWEEGVEPNFQKQTGPHPRPIQKTSDTKEVGNEFRKYYEMLYKEKNGCGVRLPYP